MDAKFFRCKNNTALNILNVGYPGAKCGTVVGDFLSMIGAETIISWRDL